MGTQKHTPSHICITHDIVTSSYTHVQYTHTPSTHTHTHTSPPLPPPAPRRSFILSAANRSGQMHPHLRTLCINLTPFHACHQPVEPKCHQCLTNTHTHTHTCTHAHTHTQRYF